MINFLFSSQIKFGFIVVLVGLLLQGCGGERTTPYNPSSSSSSSSATKVVAELITQGTNTLRDIDYKEKSLHVMRDSKEFFNFVDKYTNLNPEPPNFNSGQVVLVDMGNQESCKKRLEFNSLRAEEAGDDSVKVVVTYREIAAISGDCVISRPFYFYYIESRGHLIVEESVQ